MNRIVTVASLASLIAPVALAQWQTSFSNETSSRLVMSPTLQNDNLEKDFAWGDFDNDGDVDVICVRKFPGSIQGGYPDILLMNEGGVLVDRTQEYGTASLTAGDLALKAPVNDRDVKAVDVNLDGWIDLVTMTTMSDQVNATLGQPRVYMNLGNNGSGQWQGFRFEDARIPELFAKNGSTANPRACDAVVVDLTGDGYPDIFFVDYDTPETSGTICIDLNGDGDTADAGECQSSPAETSTKDYDNKFLVNWGTSGGPGPGYFFDSTTTRFTATQLASAFGNAVNAGDYNGDGYMDVARVNTLTSGQNVSVLYGKAPPQTGLSFTGPDLIYSNAPYHIATGDLNNDGKLDLVVVDDSQDRVLINTGNGTDGLANFTAYTISDSLSEFGNSVQLADLDNDGKLDALIADVDADLPSFCPSTGRRAHIYRNTGVVGGQLLDEIGEIIPNSSLGATFDFAPVDIDGDGWKDVVTGRCAGIEVWMNKPPIGLTFSYPSGHPDVVAPGAATGFNVVPNLLGGGPIVAGSLKLNYRVSGGAWQQSALTGGPTTFVATLPAIACGQSLDYYLSGKITASTTTYTDPAGAPATFYSAVPISGDLTVYSTEFENGVDGWTTEAIGAGVGGAWELGDPVGTSVSGVPANPENDATAAPGVNCWVTDNGAVGGTSSANDLDNGPVNLISPVFSVPAGSYIDCTYAAWAYCNDAALPAEADFLLVQYSFDGGANWTTARQIGTTGSTWQTFTDSLGPTTGTSVIVRFSAADPGNNSTTEFGVDSFTLTRTYCSTGPLCTGDLNNDGAVTCADFPLLLDAVNNGASYCADLNHDGLVNSADITAFYAIIGSGDSDGDQWPNICDNCPSTANANQADSDGDGVGNACDGCPNDPNKIAPGTCGCGVPDTDSDGDGVPNCNDGCPNDPNKIAPGACGCGVPDTDSDGDGTPNCHDGCPNDPLKTAPGTCGCGVPDTDSDGDGVPNCNDGCPNDPNKIAPGTCGCGVPDTDSDGDGTPNCNDGCPNDPNKIAPGTCGCGVADTDTDGDGVPNCNDGCPNDPNKIAPGACGCGVPDTDSDGDGVPNCNDGCPNDPNKLAPGACGCGVPDTDSDGDGTPNCNDGCPNDPLKTAPGTCGCGVADVDIDGDGAIDCIDGCPDDPNKTAPGVCGCGVPDTDSDNDGLPDCADGCPNDPNKIVPGTCGCGVPDTDSDGDGTPNCNDGCPNDPNKIAPGTCGCGVADTDTDGDGVPNCNDGCPNDPNKIAPGTCGCGVPDTDSDGDGVPNCNDGCPNDPNKIAPGACGCGVPDTDSDGDGTPNCNDGCPNDPNKIAPGTCGCGVPDTDSDGDGTPNCNDGCPNDPNKLAPGACGCGVPDTDSDGDGTPNCNDGCPNDPNKIAPGTCGCGVPDTDSDGDGTPNCIDECPNDPNKVAPGACGCGVADVDLDGDGTLDCLDGCPGDPNKSDPGVCGCGTPDDDSDEDGVPDCLDACPGFDDTLDCNSNGVPDGCDITVAHTSIDTNQNGVPDECECISDLTGDGIVNGADLALLLGAWGTGGVGDINASGTVDAADLGLLLGAWGFCAQIPDASGP
ncbi:MAG: thrombospondin type 3 repeat-containing protein [Phycisphaerales bacterium]